jgi:hypothetical protein
MADEIATRKRELRSELAELEASTHPLREQQRRRELVDALYAERRGVEVRLRLALAAGDERAPVADRSSASGWSLGPTGHELARGCEEQLVLINTEISRLTHEGER